jgi:hypothetical protein
LPEQLAKARQLADHVFLILELNTSEYKILPDDLVYIYRARGTRRIPWSSICKRLLTFQEKMGVKLWITQPFQLENTLKGLMRWTRKDSHPLFTRKNEPLYPNILDNISGISSVRKQALMERYPSLPELVKASEEDLATIQHIGKKTARIIYKALRS